MTCEATPSSLLPQEAFIQESALLPISYCSCCLAVSDSFGTQDSSLPGSSVHGISPARMLEWVAISFSRGSSQTRDQTCVSYIGR